ncbi:hypothetical protein E6O51_05000 [Pseudothauera rhizosphaerae]|uniref:Uncharacterized protein n=1 Tax=Pseudothauera rhizosphaerae TaxID=2565932 RepID=A0A4S4AUC5_9RHOO|nr:hypothetical protein E6O51_05000 [Pseudothauera rhizosphaerae]
MQSFLQQRLGWAALVLGVVAFVSGRRAPAWAGWLAGVAGLVLYSFDPAAVGALLALLTLARAAPEQRGQAQGQPGGEPGEGLGVGRLA